MRFCCGAWCLCLGLRICGCLFLLRNVYISVLYVGDRRRCVKVKLMHDSVSTALRKGAEKPNAGASVPVIVLGDHPFSYRTRNSDASFIILCFCYFLRVLWLYRCLLIWCFLVCCMGFVFGNQVCRVRRSESGRETKTLCNSSTYHFYTHHFWCVAA
jgi:hypothetical protein